jgi:hypothetical protein
MGFPLKTVSNLVHGAVSLDAGYSAAYLPRPMNRILLAFLALLGIVAQAAPVEARICGVGSAQIGAVDVSRSQARALSAQAETQEIPAVRIERRAAQCQKAPPSKKSPVYIPSVQMGIDRAYE